MDGRKPVRGVENVPIAARQLGRERQHHIPGDAHGRHAADGLELVESHAIATYIDTAFDGPPLVPTDPREAAPINRWISTVNTSVDQLLMRRYVVEYAFHKDADGNVVRDEIDKAVKRLPKMFALLEAGVAKGYLGSDAFTMADCFLMSILAGVQMFPEGKENMADCPNLTAYFAKVSERPSFAETGS